MQFVAFLRLVAVSRHFPVVLTLDAFIIAAIIGNAVGQVRLNVWQGSFYDAISRRDVSNFMVEIWVFLEIITGLIILGVIQTLCTELLKLKLREALTRELLDHWLTPGRAARLATAGEIGTNPDQRLQEDSRHLTELTTELAVGLLQATLLLASFIGVLWVLSGKLELPIGGRPVQIPGFMVWAALIYAFAGSLLAWLVGRPLIRLNAERYSREAEFRFSLVRVNEWIDSITTQRGEARERVALDLTFDRLIAISRQLVFGLTRLTVVTSSYGYLAIVAPIVVASPGYFMGSLSFGELMMVTGAFTQVQQALRWFVDNFSRIADWHATFVRIMSFRDAMLDFDATDQTEGASFQTIRRPTKAIRFDGLRLQVGGCLYGFAEQDAKVALRERVAIEGATAAVRMALVRALAGTWWQGTGKLYLPPLSVGMSILSQRAYFPLGTLADVLAYPDEARQFSPPDMNLALRSVGLGGGMALALGETRRWDKELTVSEQQCLAFARLLLHKPRWIILDGAFEALDDSSRERVLTLLSESFVDSAIIHVGEPNGAGALFERRLDLTSFGVSGDSEGAATASPVGSPVTAPSPPPHPRLKALSQ